MSRKPIVLFADSGPRVGSGHLLRSFAVFEALQKEGREALFLAPEIPPSLVALEPGYMRALGPEPDAAAVAAAIGAAEPALAVIDSYRHVHDLAAWPGLAPLRAAFDDHYAPPDGLDFLINGSPVATPARYPGRTMEALLLGPRFAAISPAFRRARARHTVRPSLTRVLASLGGRDTEGRLGALVNGLERTLPPDIEIVIVGDAAGAGVGRRVRPAGWLSQDSLADLMADCDLAVLSGGSMVGQCACVGLPAIAWPQVPNQAKHARAWEEQGTLSVCETLADLPSRLAHLATPAAREAMQAAGRRLVDGKGAERIADHLATAIPEP